MRLKCLSPIFVLLLTGCALAQGKSPHAADSPIHEAIIFVPGYYGTTLNEETSGDRFFITAGNYLFGSKSVSLHNEDLATPPAPRLIAGEVMRGVRLIPGLYTVDVYGKFMDQLRQIATDTHQEFVPFAYDWRQDLSESAQRLSAMINELNARGITRVTLVAHSMGCLISTYYLAYGDQNPDTAKLNWSGASRVHRAVLMAGPYHGAFSLFRNMQTGAKIGSNSSYMPAETVASLPASYQLLPLNDFHFFDENSKAVAFAAGDAGEWERLRLGLFRNQKLTAQLKERRRSFVAEQLVRAKLISDLLLLRPAPVTPPPSDFKILQLIGSSHPVVASAYYQREMGQFTFDTDSPEKKGLRANLLFEDGDGSVTLASAQLPDRLAPLATVMSTKLVHERVFDDAEFQKSLALFLR